MEESDVSGISLKQSIIVYLMEMYSKCFETTYENADGEEVRFWCFYPVFAGGMVGQSNEMLIGTA